MNFDKNEHELQKNNNVHWNEDIEKNVYEIGEKSKGYKIMHIKEAINVSFRYDLLMYSGILLGPIAGLLSAIGSILSPDDSPTTLPIVSACLAFISGIVVAATKYGKFEEKSSHHKMAASKYTSLESNIRRQLILYRENRQNAAQYLEWIGNSFDDLFTGSPLVTDIIYNEYIKIAKENGLVIPDEYVININDHYKKKKINEIKDVSIININTDLENNNNVNDGKVDDHIKENIINNLSHFPDINKFSDNMMNYELQRMMKI
jgi:hypothetical protein